MPRRPPRPVESPADVRDTFALQRTAGNQAVVHLLANPPVVQRSTLEVTWQNAGGSAGPGRLRIPITAIDAALLETLSRPAIVALHVALRDLRAKDLDDHRLRVPMLELVGRYLPAQQPAAADSAVPARDRGDDMAVEEPARQGTKHGKDEKEEEPPAPSAESGPKSRPGPGFATCFPDLRLHQSLSEDRTGAFLDDSGRWLVDRLALLREQLADAEDTDMVVAEAQEAVIDEEDGNESESTEYGALVGQSNKATLAALQELKDRTKAAEFGHLFVVRPMPLKEIEINIRVPRRYREEPALFERFAKETTRQLQIQLDRLNGQRLDRWFVKLDLFGAHKEENTQVQDWTQQRTPAHLGKVHHELYRRVQEEHARASLHHSAADRRTRLLDAMKLISQADTPRKRSALLAGLDQNWARDLVGRANSQTRWKQDHRAEIERLFKQHTAAGGVWEGLAGDWTKLAPLHNPDQVAGGDRHLPDRPDDVSEYVGPGVVNSAIGAGWGLPKETAVDEATEMTVVTVPSLMVQLREEMLRDYPPASWALLTTRFGFQVKFTG